MMNELLMVYGADN